MNPVAFTPLQFNDLPSPDYELAEVSQIAESIRSARQGRPRPVSLLIGAGVSVTAGIPLADRFVELIRIEHPEKYRVSPSKDYGDLMARLSPLEQADLINPFIKAATLNWAHLALAQLLKEGHVQYVFTTNFDNLLERACTVVGLDSLSVYDVAASPVFDFTRVDPPALVYLHGKFTGFNVLNARDKTERQAGVVENIIREARAHTWVVIGFSARNDSIFKCLDLVQEYVGGIYWVDIAHPRHWVPALQRFCVAKGAKKVQIAGADEALTEVSQHLRCFPPPVFLHPAAHLAALLKPVNKCQLPLPAGTADIKEICDHTLERLTSAEASGPNILFDSLLRLSIEDPLRAAESASEASTDRATLPTALRKLMLCILKNGLKAHIVTIEQLLESIESYEGKVEPPPDDGESNLEEEETRAARETLQRDVAVVTTRFQIIESFLKAASGLLDAQPEHSSELDSMKRHVDDLHVRFQLLTAFPAEPLTGELE
ncbi:MAG: hypothetical protein JNM66_08370 [Bryobacterales bacterium]|nr:hypothetical protein [Bryobacterales bacterium]